MARRTAAIIILVRFTRTQTKVNRSVRNNVTDTSFKGCLTPFWFVSMLAASPPTGKSLLIIASAVKPSGKNIPFRFSEKYDCIPPVPHPSGAYRDRHGRRAGCDGRFSAARRAAREADGEIVWSWRPDAGVKSRGVAMSALRDRHAVIRVATEANKPGTPRRARISRKPLRRGCRSVFGCTC